MINDNRDDLPDMNARAVQNRAYASSLAVKDKAPETLLEVRKMTPKEYEKAYKAPSSKRGAKMVVLPAFTSELTEVEHIDEDDI